MNLENATILRPPHEIYAIRLKTIKIEMGGDNEVIVPVVLANPHAVLLSAAEPICLNREEKVYLQPGDEVLLISIAPSIDGDTGRDRPEKVCSCYVPAYTSALADPWIMLRAEKLIVQEAYDQLKNPYINERADLVYDQMVSRHSDSKIITLDKEEYL